MSSLPKKPMHWNIDALSDVSLRDALLGNGLVHLRKVFHDLRHRERRHSGPKCTAASAQFLPRPAAWERPQSAQKSHALAHRDDSRRNLSKWYKPCPAKLSQLRCANDAQSPLPINGFHFPKTVLPSITRSSTRMASQALQGSPMVLLFDVAFWKTVTMYCGWRAPLPAKSNHPRQHNFVIRGYEVLRVKQWTFVAPILPWTAHSLFSIGSRIPHHKRHNTKPFLYRASRSTIMHGPLADASMLHTHLLVYSYSACSLCTPLSDNSRKSLMCHSLI